MRRTNLRGHALRGEGMGHKPGDEDEPWVTIWRGWTGVGLCECGEVSPVLESNADRKRWHIAHKDEIRAQLEASRAR